jgi:nitrite reductase/ring-hydroxylating ferredoxin subunit
MDESTQWVKVDPDGLAEGQVMTVVAGGRAVCLTRTAEGYGALDNRCPHQGGPLGEGSIENGLLRCPWHGYDYCPLDGSSPGYDDEATTYPLEIRDGDVYVSLTPSNGVGA